MSYKGSRNGAVCIIESVHRTQKGADDAIDQLRKDHVAECPDAKSFEPEDEDDKSSSRGRLFEHGWCACGVGWTQDSAELSD